MENIVSFEEKKAEFVEVAEFEDVAQHVEDKKPDKIIGKEYMGDDNKIHVPIIYRGVEVDFVPSRLKNNAVFYCLGKLSDEKSRDDVMKWQSRLFDLLFGEDEVFDLLEKLSYDENGVEDPSIITDFMTFLITEVADAKN